MAPYNRILITGAAGRLGTHLRSGLAPLADKIRLSDRQPITDLQPHEESAICDLSDFDAVLEMTRDCDAIVHFGGAPMERPWQEVLDSSIRGSYHIYEGARKAGVRRVVYASSVHAIGYHPVEDHIDAALPGQRLHRLLDAIIEVAFGIVEHRLRRFLRGRCRRRHGGRCG